MAITMLVHQRMQFSTFNYFACTLVSHSKLLRNIMAFGADGDRNLTRALAHNFPFCLLTAMFCALQEGCSGKLCELPIPKQVSQKFLDEIFGKRKGNIRVDGLVDACSVEDFDDKLEAVTVSWNERDSQYASQVVPKFCNHLNKPKLM